MIFPTILSFFIVLADDGSASIRFVPCAYNAELRIGEAMEHPIAGEIHIDRFQFHVGPITAYVDGDPVEITDRYHLIDGREIASFAMARASTIDSISFLLGVDSLTNVSGVLGDDLDPTNGMYWTWNSGYINVKLEGRAAVSPYPKKEFELHLGGYLPPHRTAQHIVLQPRRSGDITIYVDTMELLDEVDLSSRCNVMSPGEEAVRLSKAAKRMFKLE